MSHDVPEAARKTPIAVPAGGQQAEQMQLASHERTPAGTQAAAPSAPEIATEAQPELQSPVPPQPSAVATGAEASAVPGSASVPPAPLPDRVQDFRRAAPRPMLGGSILVFGVLLWSYVVVGEWVVNLKLPESVGLLMVLAAFGLACLTSAKRGAGRTPFGWSALVPGLAGLVMFAVVVSLVSSFFGSTRRSAIAVVSVALWFLSALAYSVGRKLARKKSRQRRGVRLALSIALWAASGLFTLVALVGIMSRG